MTTLTATTSTTTVTGNTDGTLTFSVGSGPTTALTLGTDQKATFVAPVIASATSGAPLTIPTGTLETSPSAGDFEYDGNLFYATPVTSARAVVQTLVQGYNSSTLTGPVATTPVRMLSAGTNGAISVIAGNIYVFETLLISTVTGAGVTSRSACFKLVNSAVSGAATVTFYPFIMGSSYLSTGSTWSNTFITGAIYGTTDGGASNNAAFTPAITTAANAFFMYAKGCFQATTSGYLSPAYFFSAGATVTYTTQPATFFTATQLGYSASTTLSIGPWA